MNILFLVNDATAIQPSQTTAMLIGAAVNQGHRVGVVGVGELSCRDDGEPWGQVRWLSASVDPSSSALSSSALSLPALIGAIAQTPPTATGLLKVELLLLRTNPARDLNRAAAHHLALMLAQRCQDSGVCVVNRPEGLQWAATKLYLLNLPTSTRPTTLVSQNIAEIRAFIQELQGPAVLKPLQGTRGNDVFFVASDQDPNLNAMIAVLQRQGAVMVQRCIPGSEAGDTRVVVFRGEVLRLDGQAAAIRRVPRPGDFRSNLHAGGHAEPAIVTAAMETTVAAIAPQLLRDGLFLVGLDFIGDQLLEVNVFSTGGLRDAERFTGQPFSHVLLDKLVAGAIA